MYLWLPEFMYLVFTRMPGELPPIGGSGLGIVVSLFVRMTSSAVPKFPFFAEGF